MRMCIGCAVGGSRGRPALGRRPAHAAFLGAPSTPAVPSRVATPNAASRVPAAVSDALQAGLRHRLGEAVAHLLPDGSGNRHEAGLQDLLPRRAEDLLQDRARDLLQDASSDRLQAVSTRPARRTASTPSASRATRPATRRSARRSASRSTRPATRNAATRSASRSARRCTKDMLLHRLQAGLRDALPQALPPGLQAGLRAALQGSLLHRLQAGLRDLLQGRLLHRLQAGLRDAAARTSARPATRLRRDLLQGPASRRSASRSAPCKTVHEEVRRVVRRAYCVPGKMQDALVRTATTAASTPAPARPAASTSNWSRCSLQGAGPDLLPARSAKERDVCEQVPCTTYVKECVCREGALHRLQEGARTRSSRRCRYTVTRDRHGDHRQEGARTPSPGRRPRCAASRCPYTTTRTVRGAYVDLRPVSPPGERVPVACERRHPATTARPRAGSFVEGSPGAQRSTTYTTTRMVQRDLPQEGARTPSWRTVTEDCSRRCRTPSAAWCRDHGRSWCPYTVCTMVQQECVKNGAL